MTKKEKLLEFGVGLIVLVVLFASVFFVKALLPPSLPQNANDFLTNLMIKTVPFLLLVPILFLIYIVVGFFYDVFKEWRSKKKRVLVKGV